jgi:hypothetical protein
MARDAPRDGLRRPPWQGQAILPVPGVIGAANAKLAKIFGLAAALPFGESEPILAMEDSVCGNEKLQAQLGITPRGFHETLATYAGTI